MSVTLVARYAGQVVLMPKGTWRRSTHYATAAMLACPRCGSIVPLMGRGPSVVDCSSCEWHGVVRLDGWRQ